jgi:hypothetical protein
MYVLAGFSAQCIIPLPEWPLTISSMLNAGAADREGEPDAA